MTARDDIAKVLAEHAGCVPNPGPDNSGSGLTGVDIWTCGIRVPYIDQLDDMERAHLADALLASPAHAHLLDEARAEGWDVGRSAGHSDAQSYANYGTGCGPDSWDCDCLNPYRKDTP